MYVVVFETIVIIVRSIMFSMEKVYDSCKKVQMFWLCLTSQTINGDYERMVILLSQLQIKDSRQRLLVVPVLQQLHQPQLLCPCHSYRVSWQKLLQKSSLCLFILDTSTNHQPFLLQC